MKCYLLMNTTSKRNSTISLKIYENWRPQDDHSCRTCIRVTELCKGALGKIKNTSKNYGRGRPSQNLAFCFKCIAKELRGQDKNSAKCFKCSSQIHKITKHGVYEKFLKV